MKTIKDLLGTPESIRLDGRKKEFREKLKKLAYEKAKKEAEAGAPIDEISKDLAGRYAKKRADDLPHAGYMMNDPHSSERRKKGVRDYVKMQKGVKTAVNKLTGKAMVPATEATINEKNLQELVTMFVEADEKNLQELSPELLKRYHDKAMKYYKRHTRYNTSHSKKPETLDTLDKRHKGLGSAINRGVARGKYWPKGPSTRSDTVKTSTMGGKLPHELPKGYMSKKSMDKRAADRAVEDKTTDAERAAIDAFMKKKGAKQLPPGKAQGHHGKSFSIKPMGISPKKMGVSSPSRLDKDMVHKEDKAYGPTGIAYSVPKGHPDAVDPKTGKKKNAKNEHVGKTPGDNSYYNLQRAKELARRDGHDYDRLPQYHRGLGVPHKAHYDDRAKNEDTVASVAKDLEKVTKKDKVEKMKNLKSFMRKEGVNEDIRKQYHKPEQDKMAGKYKRGQKIVKDAWPNPDTWWNEYIMPNADKKGVRIYQEGRAFIVEKL